MPEYTIMNYRAICLSSNNPYLITLWTRLNTDARPFEIGWIWFMPDGQTLPAANIDSSGRINLYYSQGRFTTILELLRNEKPIQLFFQSGSEAGLRTIQCGPAGQDECLPALFSRPDSTSLAME